MKILMALLVLFIPTLASAQVHPCDATLPASVTVSAGTHTLVACWSDQDFSVPALTVTASQWGVTWVPNGARTIVAMTKTTPTANAAGLFQYSGSVTVPKGNLTVTIDVCIDDGTGSLICTGLVSPFAVKSQGPGPKPPVKGSVQ